MIECHDPILEAVEALKRRGHKVEPCGVEFDAWLVDGKSLPDGDLLALAVRLGLMDSPGRRQYAAAMAKGIPSVGDLGRTSTMSDDEIAAAAAAHLKDENARPFAFKSGHRVDVAKAIEMHPQAKKLLADKAIAPGLRRTMVMTAVIMGFPAQG